MYGVLCSKEMGMRACLFYAGCLCGSSSLNEVFRRDLEARLKDAVDDHLERNSRMYRAQILDRAVDWFEIEKRGFQGPDESPYYAPVTWLRESEENRFAPGSVEFSR
jgi:hypothetical protein